MDLSKLTYQKQDGEKELQPVSRLAKTPDRPSPGWSHEPRAVPEGYQKAEPILATDIIYIISGGEKRERDYFHLIEYSHSIRRVKIAFVSKKGQGMNPSQMRDKADECLRTRQFPTPNHVYTINDGDTLYLLSDVDEYKDILTRELARSTASSQMLWIVSNPAFEIWLYYHYYAQPYPALEEGKGKSPRELSQWLKLKLSQLHKGGVNPIKAFEHIQTAIQNSQHIYEDENGLPTLYSTQMHLLAQRIVDAMGEEFDNLIRQRTEKAKAFRQQNLSQKQHKENVSEEKKRFFVQRLAEYARDCQLQLPLMKMHYEESLTEKDVKAFAQSYKVEKSYFDMKSPMVESNLPEVFLNDIKQESEHYYETLFLMQIPVQTYTIDFSEIKDAFDVLGLDRDYEVLASFPLNTFDFLYGGRLPFDKTANGYLYGDLTIDWVNLRERCMYIMVKEFVPRTESKLYEGNNADFDLTIPEQNIYTNINHMQELPDGFGLSVMRVIRYSLPHQANFRYIKLNIADYHKEKSEFSKLNKGDIVKLRYSAGDIVRIKSSYRELYEPVFKHDKVFEIWGINTNGTLNLKTIDTPVPYSHVEPVRIDGIGDKDIYYDPFIAASLVAPGEAPPVHHTDHSYYLEHFKKNIFEGKKTTLYDLCMSQKFRYVHEIQHWLRDMYGWDRLMINHRMG